MDIQIYTQRARSVIKSAQSEAVMRDHQQLTPLHIMAGLAAEDGGLPVKLMQMAGICLLYTSPSPRDATLSRMPSSA